MENDYMSKSRQEELVDAMLDEVVGFLLIR